MICFPNAKINLGLSIIEKRSDGMHNIETCFIPIPLYDILEILPADRFSIEHFGLPIPDATSSNLIVRAWNLLLSIKENIQPVKVCLYKNIPIASGLGGGSSDAAFFIKEINKLYALGFTSGDMELLAGKIGADCPFFIKNQVSIAEGTGNIFTEVENPVSGMFVTVVFPRVQISTKDAFSKLNPKTDSNLTKVLHESSNIWKNYLRNDFEEIIFKDYPEIHHIKNILYSSGALYSSLTGSGSAIYALSTKPLDIIGLEKKNIVWSGILD